MFSLYEKRKLFYVRTLRRVYRLLIIFKASGFPVISKFQSATCNLQPATYNLQPAKHTCRNLQQPPQSESRVIV